MATVYFTSIVKKESINAHFTSQKSNCQYNKGSFIPRATFSPSKTQAFFQLPAGYQILQTDPRNQECVRDKTHRKFDLYEVITVIFPK